MYPPLSVGRACAMHEFVRVRCARASHCVSPHLQATRQCARRYEVFAVCGRCGGCTPHRTRATRGRTDVYQYMREWTTLHRNAGGAADMVTCAKRTSTFHPEARRRHPTTPIPNAPAKDRHHIQRMCFNRPNVPTPTDTPPRTPNFTRIVQRVPHLAHTRN